MISSNNLPTATNGTIFYRNFRSSLEQAWRNMLSMSDTRQIEEIIKIELMNVQFFADYDALDRLLFLSA